MIIWIDAKKASDKIQPPFVLKTHSGYKGNISQHNKNYLWQIHTQYDTSNSEKLKDFLYVKSGTKQNIENNVPYLLCK